MEIIQESQEKDAKPEEEVAVSTKDADVKEKKKEFEKATFKKPTLMIGPRRRKPGILPRVVSTVESQPDPIKPKKPKESNDESEEENSAGVHKLERQITGLQPQINSANSSSLNQKQVAPLSYSEPSWGGIPTDKYSLEILKSGVIMNTIELTKKSFFTVGRLPVCDIVHSHPSTSRYHAIFQFRPEADGENAPGFYIYDLGSTHGTFWNGNRIKSKTYVKLHGGHMVKFGLSDRKFILQAPEDDVEAESELSVTELKEKRRLELLEREKKKLEMEELERIRKEEEEKAGIDWGMGEDADEENDLTENPFASTNNEELFLDDPKKTLRGWFEREGHDLQYQVEEKSVGQYLCWISLPIDSVGRPVKVEVDYKGKKKEAVYQCALEACRTLDRYGLLRQATHEGRKRKAKNWEEDDYYDSDEDNFLDRTGSIERKREQRMRNAGKLETKVENYSSLLEKHSKVVEEIKKIESKLENHVSTKQKLADNNSGEDALDAFMSNLNSAVLNKSDVLKLKSQLINLRKEEEALKKLVDIAKPASLPSLNIKKESGESDKKKSPEKRLKIEDKEEVIENDDENNSKKLKNKYGLILSDELETEEMKVEAEEKNEEKKEEKPEIEKEVESEPVEKPILKEQKKSQRKSQQKAQKPKEKKTNYDEDNFKEDYSMWVPPQNQLGDGKTSLNDKFGY